MNLKLRPVEDLAEALAHKDLLERGAAESSRSFRDEDPPAGSAVVFLERHFEAQETLLVLAEEAGQPKPWGFCLTGPLEDPWTGEHMPMILALWVETRIRHRGVARSLVKEAGRLLGQRGLPAVSARAGYNEDVLISMGERWGFLRKWEFMLQE